MKKIKLDGTDVFYEVNRKRVRNINMTIKSPGVLYVSAPWDVSESLIEDVLYKKRKFIINAVNKLKNNSETSEDIGHVRFLGKKYPVQISTQAGETAVMENDILVVKTLCDPAQNKTHIKEIIINWQAKKCSEIFPDVYLKTWEDFISHGYDLPKSKIRLKYMKTRWGSCNVKTADLSMNIRLIEYPTECIYGVFYHELTHLLHADHSKAFYDDLIKMYPDYRRWDRILKGK